MQFQITSDNMEVTPSMKTLAESKFKRLEKQLAQFPKDAVTIRIVMNKASADDMFKVKVEMSVNGDLFVGKGKDFNMETALIDAVGDVSGQFSKEKSKYESRTWEKQREAKRFVEEPIVGDEMDLGEWEKSADNVVLPGDDE